MYFGRLATGSAFGLALLCAAQVGAQERLVARDEPLRSRIWLDRGVNPVLLRGHRVRVFYRASRDAYVSIFHIDTNGFLRMLHPGSAADDHRALAGRDYRVLFPESRYWRVDEDEGKGYLFVVASPTPFDFSGFAYSRREGGWNLGAVGRATYRDPFLVMDDVVAALVPESAADDYALDFVAYDIEVRHDHPRFLCYQCHGFRPMFDWNPYTSLCTDFRVVVDDDPYYYPMYRYSGDRVVYSRPPAAGRPMFTFEARVDDETGTPRIGARSRDPSEDEPAVDAARWPGMAPAARVPGPPGPLGPGMGARDSVGGRPVLQRREEPPPAGSGRPPGARPRTPPGDPRPPTATRRPGTANRPLPSANRSPPSATRPLPGAPNRRES